MQSLGVDVIGVFLHFIGESRDEQIFVDSWLTVDVEFKKILTNKK